MGTVSLTFAGLTLQMQPATGAPIMLSRQFTPVTTGDAARITCIAEVDGTPEDFFDRLRRDLIVQSNVNSCIIVWILVHILFC